MEEDFSKYNGEGTELRKVQLQLLDILVEFDKICKKHNIQYWLDYGTLLGAVRHKGFIPWDDDMDIAVRWDDYNRLQKILPEELPNYLIFKDWKNSTFHSRYGKILNIRQEDFQLDIFPMHNRLSYHIFYAIDFVYSRSFRRLRGFNDKKVEKVISVFCWILLRPIVAVAEFLSQMIHTDKIGQPYGGSPDVLSLHRKVSEIFPLSTVTFEGREFPCPKDVDGYLKMCYGDYKKLPEENERIGHVNL